MHNSITRLLDNRPQMILLSLLAAFVVMLGCGGGGGGGGGSNGTNANGGNNGSTNSETNGTTTSETTGSTGSTLPVNRIFFVDSSQDVKHIDENGGDEQTYVDMTANFKAFAQNPVNAGNVAFGYTNAPGPDADYAIYTNATVAFAGATRLTQTTFKDIGSVMYTPDGTQIVFTGATSVGTPQEPQYRYRLYVISSTSANQTPTPIDDADDAFVSPTGTRIVYTFWPTSASSPRIKAIDLDGGNPAVLTTSGDTFLPQYNKTGDKISYTSNQSGQYEIWTMASNGSSKLKITSVNSSAADRCFGSSWSPSGTEIAFTRVTLSGATSGVYKVAAAGGTATNIRPGSVQPYVFWSPLGSGAITRAPGAAIPGSLGTSQRIKDLVGIKE